jgi:methanogenic corrinoid protein MtbC1
VTGLVRPSLERLFSLVVSLNEAAALEEVASLLRSGVEARTIMLCFNRALTEIGRLFQAKEYYMVALVLAGELMRDALAILMPRLSRDGGLPAKEGLVVTATIEGDIHDLGKSLAGFLLAASGFEVVDLGVDVPPKVIVDETMRRRPDAVGVSLLLTNCVPAVQRLSVLFREAYQGEKERPLLFAGCGFSLPPESDLSPPAWLGVDTVAKDAYETVQICLERVGGESQGAIGYGAP